MRSQDCHGLCPALVSVTLRSVAGAGGGWAGAQRRESRKKRWEPRAGGRMDGGKGGVRTEALGETEGDGGTWKY